MNSQQIQERIKLLQKEIDELKSSSLLKSLKKRTAQPSKSFNQNFDL